MIDPRPRSLHHPDPRAARAPDEVQIVCGVLGERRPYRCLGSVPASPYPGRLR